jgi:hypothetical protein
MSLPLDKLMFCLLVAVGLAVRVDQSIATVAAAAVVKLYLLLAPTCQQVHTQ